MDEVKKENDGMVDFTKNSSGVEIRGTFNSPMNSNLVLEACKSEILKEKEVGRMDSFEKTGRAEGIEYSSFIEEQLGKEDEEDGVEEEISVIGGARVKKEYFSLK